jgi:hypothetical protein
LEVAQLFVKNPSPLLVSPTEAVLFHSAQNLTQLLDEVDSWTNRDQLKSVLNSAYRKGGTVPRMLKNKKGNYDEIKYYPVYTAIAMAGIGTKILDPTTRDRTFMIGMVRQKRGERRAKLNKRTRQGALPLQQRVLGWVRDCAQEVAEVYEADEFPYLDDFGDRTIDISESLAAVLEVAYKDHPRADEVREEFLEAISICREDEQNVTLEHTILQELLRLAETENPLIGSATELAAKCAGFAEPPDLYRIARVLQKYGFKTKSKRLNGGDPMQRYVLSREALADLVARYAST